VALVRDDRVVVGQAAAEVHDQRKPGEREDADVPDVAGADGRAELVREDLVDGLCGRRVVPRVGRGLAREAAQVDLDALVVAVEREARRPAVGGDGKGRGLPGDVYRVAAQLAEQAQHNGLRVVRQRRDVADVRLVRRLHDHQAFDVKHSGDELVVDLGVAGRAGEQDVVGVVTPGLIEVVEPAR
jgi:hypothetical protein